MIEKLLDDWLRNRIRERFPDAKIETPFDPLPRQTDESVIVFNITNGARQWESTILVADFDLSAHVDVEIPVGLRSESHGVIEWLFGLAVEWHNNAQSYLQVSDSINWSRSSTDAIEYNPVVGTIFTGATFYANVLV